MKLPLAFTDKLKGLLKNEYCEFIDSFDYEYYKGIRINTLKLSVDEYLEISPFILEPIPWTSEGFYYLNGETTEKPSKHPHYYCGLYYIQEPSAMIPVEILDPKPGDKVLDISAAPGGKATQIAAKLKGKGVLVANDIVPKRVKALVKNIELFGMKNCIVTNDKPEKLANCFDEYFDKILVDAPCSGEGMFRRDPKAVKSWTESKVYQCCDMQKDILQWVSKLLKPGGKLVYSTCTFSPEENEGTIDWLLKEFPEFEIMNIEGIDGIDRGRPEWIGGNSSLVKAGRAWPHKIKGEGHFFALLRKKGEKQTKDYNYFKRNTANIDTYLQFEKDNLRIKLEDRLHRIGDILYLMPKDIPELSGIKVVNPGLYVGKLLKNRFEPSQALAMVLKKDEVINSINFSSKSVEAKKYLKGETILIDEEKGWKLICIDDYPVGWGKQIQGSLKNYYRSHWRMK